jgi:hypothetical protein
MIKIVNESEGIPTFNYPEMNKLAAILMSNGKLTDNGNYRIDGSTVSAYYSPKEHRIVAMDPIWGSPKYVYDGSLFYRMNIEGKKAKLTGPTMIKTVMKSLGSDKSIDDYDESGKLIKE